MKYTFAHNHLIFYETLKNVNLKFLQKRISVNCSVFLVQSVFFFFFIGFIII